jgi:hypothetical protein
MCACRLLGFDSVFWQSFQAFGGVFFGGALLYLMSSLLEYSLGGVL